MRYLKSSLLLSAVFLSSGCATINCKPKAGTVLPGTDTAVVGIYLDKSGYPQSIVDEVVVHPGQKIVFSGPSRFDILFKDQKSPVEKFEVPSENGIVVIEIPKNILDRQKAAGSKEGLIYRYGIRANGNVTDPTIRVEPM